MIVLAEEAVARTIAAGDAWLGEFAVADVAAVRRALLEEEMTG